MNWSTTKPTEAGLYWFRYSPRHDRGLMEVTVLQTGVSNSRIAKGRKLDSGDDRNLLLSEFGGECQWAGPITAPVEPAVATNTEEAMGTLGVVAHTEGSRFSDGEVRGAVRRVIHASSGIISSPEDPEKATQIRREIQDSAMQGEIPAEDIRRAVKVVSDKSASITPDDPDGDGYPQEALK